MADLRTAAQQALSLLDEIHRGNMTPMAEEAWDKAITALKTALKQPEPEPVAWIQSNHLQQAQREPFLCRVEPTQRLPDFVPIFAHPPRREWQGLTEEEVEYPHPPAKPPVYATSQNTEAVRDGFVMGGYEKEPGYYSEEQLDEFARAIEAALRSKNDF